MLNTNSKKLSCILPTLNAIQIHVRGVNSCLPLLTMVVYVIHVSILSFAVFDVIASIFSIRAFFGG